MRFDVEHLATACYDCSLFSIAVTSFGWSPTVMTTPTDSLRALCTPITTLCMHSNSPTMPLGRLQEPRWPGYLRLQTLSTAPPCTQSYSSLHSFLLLLTVVRWHLHGVPCIVQEYAQSGRNWSLPERYQVSMVRYLESSPCCIYCRNSFVSLPGDDLPGTDEAGHPLHHMTPPARCQCPYELFIACAYFPPSTNRFVPISQPFDC